MRPAFVGDSPLRRTGGRRSPALLRWQRRTAAVGIGATALAFGPARLAYGMLLPSIRGDLSFSAGQAGLIASGAFAGFAAALLAASLLSRVAGAKLPILVGGLCATGGCATVAMAGGVPTLATGVIVAGLSAGFCWTPFNALAGRLVRRSRRDGLLSVVSTGTTLGIAAMGLGALALAWTGAGWRLAWWATAAAAGLVTALACALLPSTGRLRPEPSPHARHLTAAHVGARVLRPQVRPFHALALAFGAVTGVFSTFAVDHVAASAESGPLLVGGLVFLSYGIWGALGFGTARLERRVGLRAALALCVALAGLGCLGPALWPGAWAVVLAASGAMGASVMIFAALLSVTALRLFPALPVIGLTALVLAMSVGSMAGPPLAGLLADWAGTGPALGAAALLAGAALPLALSAAADGRGGRSRQLR
ncbi:MFS transporter [Jannaschia formosa]|uniref:MFS transporter n=1 Tax=Jannaschia formosa TaxID=2259592 RepID=UPI001432251D|nr:MFS transporter [Jannaschia formosa]